MVSPRGLHLPMDYLVDTIPEVLVPAPAGGAGAGAGSVNVEMAVLSQ